jgi:hypothetical protein
MKRSGKLLFVSLAAAGLLAAQDPQSKPAKPKPEENKLVSGKLIYVGPMPGGIDQWLIQDLKDWGRYKTTRNPEGVDLELKSYRPSPKRGERERRPVVLVPGPERPRREKRREEGPSVAVIDVTNWVTGDVLWSADIVDKKPKKNEEPATARTTRIFAHGMSSEQLAATITRALRAYVERIASGDAPRIPPLHPSQP